MRYAPPVKNRAGNKWPRHRRGETQSAVGQRFPILLILFGLCRRALGRMHFQGTYPQKTCQVSQAGAEPLARGVTASPPRDVIPSAGAVGVHRIKNGEKDVNARPSPRFVWRAGDLLAGQTRHQMVDAVLDPHQADRRVRIAQVAHDPLVAIVGANRGDDRRLVGD